MWLPEDRDVVAVWQSEEARRCPGCGTYEWEWAEDEYAYVPDHWTCPGCLMIEQHAAQLESTTGVKVGLFRGGHGD